MSMRNFNNIDPLKSKPENTWKVPVGFFEESKDRILRETISRDNPSVKSKGIVWLNQLILAASFILFAFISISLVKIFLNKEVEETEGLILSEMYFEPELEWEDEQLLFEMARESGQIELDDSDSDYQAYLVEYLSNEMDDLDLVGTGI